MTIERMKRSVIRLLKEGGGEKEGGEDCKEGCSSISRKP